MGTHLGPAGDDLLSRLRCFATTPERDRPTGPNTA